MIIIGYQAIGKSTLSGWFHRWLDLESTNTWFEENGERKRWPNWAEIYVNFAVDLSVNQRYNVFVSSHREVRLELMKHVKETKIVVCCPSLELKDQWIERLQKRYDQSGLDKDYRALMNAKDRYTENIQELMESGFPVIQITSMNYDLPRLIDNDARAVADGFHGR